MYDEKQVEPTKSDAISSLAGVNASVGAGAGTRPDPLEEARAERKRRQKLAQEQFRQRHLAKQPSEGTDAATQALEKSSIDSLLLEIPSQDLSSNAQTNAKRKSNESTASVKRPALTDINIMK
ncbi:hypothetical protein EVAR_25193_1 [Eumeta japonica]|uniref:Uncharacterized protein n=1 Tax=Eumeta variegata TaxID=151549 RepID=A0A4C1WGD9_EUMVA|nr:hypothetical protein EVAR_25193_1 [Eumeta japonica]